MCTRIACRAEVCKRKMTFLQDPQMIASENELLHVCIPLGDLFYNTSASQRPARDSLPYRLMSKDASCGTPAHMFRSHGQMGLSMMIFSKLPLAVLTSLRI